MTNETVGDITIRDYFAGLALQGMMANPKTVHFSIGLLLPKISYEIADAMMKEREK